MMCLNGSLPVNLDSCRKALGLLNPPSPSFPSSLTSIFISSTQPPSLSSFFCFLLAVTLSTFIVILLCKLSGLRPVVPTFQFHSPTTENHTVINLHVILIISSTCIIFNPWPWRPPPSLPSFLLHTPWTPPPIPTWPSIG